MSQGASGARCRLRTVLPEHGDEALKQRVLILEPRFHFFAESKKFARRFVKSVKNDRIRLILLYGISDTN